MVEWFCNIAGREIGPLSSHQLKAMADAGQIAPTDHVRRGTDGHWTSASHVRGLFAAEQADASSPPPPPPSMFTSPVPNVAWPTEPPPPEPEQAVPPPLPVAPDVETQDAGAWFPTEETGPVADHAAPFDPFDLSDDYVSSRKAHLALSARARRKRQQQTLLIGSLVFVVCGVLLAILLLMIGNSDATSKSEAKPPSTASQSAKKDEPTTAKKPEDAAKSSNAAVLRVVVDDVPVRVVSATRGGAAADGAAGEYLLITVEVKNPDPGEKREFAGWSRDANQRGAVLTDDHGKAYPAKSVDAAAVLGAAVPSSIGPLESVRDVLAFDRPDTKAEWLQFHLPGEAFGRASPATFKIPVTMIAEKPVVVKLSPNASKGGEPKKKRSEPRPGTPEYDFGIKVEENSH